VRLRARACVCACVCGDIRLVRRKKAFEAIGQNSKIIFLKHGIGHWIRSSHCDGSEKFLSWNITLRNPKRVRRRLEGICLFHLQSGRESQERYQL
jgi:hypothetical protein